MSEEVLAVVLDYLDFMSVVITAQTNKFWQQQTSSKIKHKFTHGPFKIALLGANETGKTSFVNKFMMKGVTGKGGWYIDRSRATIIPGMPTTFVIRHRTFVSSYNPDFEVVVLSAKSKFPLEGFIYKEEAGAFGVRFFPVKNDDYEVSVKLEENHLPGSPFVLSAEKKILETNSVCLTSSITLYTTIGFVHFELYDPVVSDVTEEEKIVPLQSNGYILFFDTLSRMSYKQIMGWWGAVQKNCGKIPGVLVGNKVDNSNRKVRPKQITFAKKQGLDYFDISTMANYNLEKPLLSLIRLLSKDTTVEFVKFPQFAPPEVQLTSERISELERDYNTIYAPACILDDDDL